MKKTRLGIFLAGLGAGAVNGLFGSGGGMVLIPLLTACTDLQDNEIFPASVSIILPICLVSICFSFSDNTVTFASVLPYLFGSVAGGVLAGFFSKKIPTKWLHKFLGLLIIWGGIQYLC